MYIFYFTLKTIVASFTCVLDASVSSCSPSASPPATLVLKYQGGILSGLVTSPLGIPNEDEELADTEETTPSPRPALAAAAEALDTAKPLIMPEVAEAALDALDAPNPPLAPIGYSC